MMRRLWIIWLWITDHERYQYVQDAEQWSKDYDDLRDDWLDDSPGG